MPFLTGISGGIVIFQRFSFYFVVVVNLVRIMSDIDNDKQVHLQLSKLGGTVESLKYGSFELMSSVRILRLIGYGMLGLALFDLIETVISNSNFGNAISMLQLIGAFVEKSPVSLLGLGLVLIGGLNERYKWERFLLKVLSWLTLLVGILYILLIPLAIANTVLVNNVVNTYIDGQYQQKLTQASGFEERFKQATPEAVEEIVKRQGGSLGDKSPQQLKDKILADVNQSKAQLKSQADAAKSQQKKSWLTKSIKWNLGALIAGTLFISIWKYTTWIRVSKAEE